MRKFTAWGGLVFVLWYVVFCVALLAVSIATPFLILAALLHYLGVV